MTREAGTTRKARKTSRLEKDKINKITINQQGTNNNTKYGIFIKQTA